MRTILLLPVAALLGCVTTSTSGDVRAVETAVSERLKLTSLALPDPADSTEFSSEVDELLKGPLTPERAARVALLANRSARAQLAQLGIARGAFVQAGVLPNPHAEVDVRAPGGPQPTQVDLGLDYELTALVLSPLRQDVAESELAAARWSAAGALLELSHRARLACLELQGAQAHRALREKSLKSLEASAAAATELHRVGNLPPLELSSHQAALETARLLLAEAEGQVRQRKELLVQALGLPGNRAGFEVAPLTTRLPAPLPAEAAEAAAVAQSLELEHGRERAEAAARRVSLSQVEGWLPQLTAGFHGQRDGTFWELGGHVAVGLPSFDHGQGKALSAQSELDLWRSRGQSEGVRVASLARAASARLDAALARLAMVNDRLLPIRTRALQESLAEYNAMALSVFELLAAQRALTEAEAMSAEAMLEAWKADAALSLLLAGLSPAAEGAAAWSPAPSLTVSAGH